MGKAARRRQAPPKERFDLDSFEPIQLKEPAAEESDAIEQVHAFSIGETEYFVPTRVPFFHSVKAMEVYATKGEQAGVAYELRTVLGNEAYEALMGFEGLTEKQFQAILKLSSQIIHASAGKAQ
jgi:hypothetical protein